MKSLLYNLLIQMYGVALRMAFLFNKKARKFITGRKNLFGRLSKDFAKNEVPVAWFHCASLGEFEQGRPVIEAMKEQMPDYKILLTFFSPSGYEVRKNYQGADYIYYLPLDTPGNARRFIKITKPRIAFFVKYEFWHNYILALKRNGIPVVSFSAIFRVNQLFFKPWGGFYRNILHNISHIFVQNDASLKLLKNIAVTRASVAGDTRFDRVWKICSQFKVVEGVAAFKGNQQLMVVGSSWPEDLEVLIPLINANAKIKFIIAPHEIREADMASLEKRLQRPSIRYSSLNDRDTTQHQVLIVDNVGMLSSLYRFGDFAYIGGAFGKGLHNILEAATFGLPVFFGDKNYKKFREARDLIARGGAFAVSDSTSLSGIFDKLIDDPATRARAGVTNTGYVKQNTGATKKILDHCKNNLLNEGQGF